MNSEMNSKRNKRILIILHLMIMLYSFSAVLSKTAAGSEFLSFKYCACYTGIVFLLGIYAIGWQQIIKRLPLNMAFSNKAVTVIWGIIWGRIFFGEPVTTGKMIGASLVILGIVLYAMSEISQGESVHG